MCLWDLWQWQTGSLSRTPLWALAWCLAAITSLEAWNKGISFTAEWANFISTPCKSSCPTRNQVSRAGRCGLPSQSCLGGDTPSSLVGVMASDTTISVKSFIRCCPIIKKAKKCACCKVVMFYGNTAGTKQTKLSSYIKLESHQMIIIFTYNLINKTPFSISEFKTIISYITHSLSSCPLPCSWKNLLTSVLWYFPPPNQ